MTAISYLSTFGDPQPGHHLCAFYETEAELQALLTGWLRRGLELNQKCLCIANANSRLADWVQAHTPGLDLGPALTRGQLICLAADQAHQHSEASPNSQMLSDRLRAEIERASAEGYTALRLFNEMAWAQPDAGRLVKYEARTHQLLSGSPMLALCAYDRRRFSAETLLELLHLHPLVVVNAEVHENIYYLPQPEFLESGLPETILSDHLQSLAKRKQADAAWRQREQLFASLVENAADAVMRFDTELRLVYCNPAVERQLGAPAGQWLGKKPLELGGFTEQAEFMDGALRRALETRQELQLEQRLPAPSGAKYFQIRIVPELGASGQVASLLAITHDITEHKQAEEALRRSEERFSKAFHVSPIGMNLARLSDRRIADVNQADLEIFGYTREEVIGKTVQELGIILSGAEWEDVYRNLAQTGSLRRAEKQLRRKDGTLRDLLISAEITEINGEKHALWLHLDITERRQAEEALRKSEAQLANALKIAHLGHWEYDVSQDQFLFNDHFYRIFRTTAEEVGGYTMSSAEYARRFVHPEDAPLVGFEIQKALETAEPHFSRQLEHRCLYADGQVGYVTVRFFVVKDEQGRTVKTYGVNQDITERKQAEEKVRQLNAELEQRVATRTAELSARSSELQQANAELLRANRLKDEFLANMSHELRTPLTAILGLAEALQMDNYGPLLAKQSEMLQVIRQSGQHLLALITDILDLSKLEAGKGELRLAPTATLEVCQAGLRHIKQTAQKKNVRVMFASDPQVDLLLADGQRLKQMLVNLLNNAIKFTPEGGQAGLEVVGDAAQREVRFIVWDTGIGITLEEQVRLFQPFMQADGSSTRKYEGAGLGLALTRRLAEMHGGRVSVESQGAGQGSRFILTLPWQPAEMPSHRPADKAPAPAALTLPSGRPPIILLADDDEATRLAIGDFLQSLSASVVTAQTGQEALLLAQTARPNLILMDIQMPDVDGLEAIRRLKAARATAPIPIVAFTALVMSGDGQRCLAAGANAYLGKPVTLVDLAQTISQLLAQTESG